MMDSINLTWLSHMGKVYLTLVKMWETMISCQNFGNYDNYHKVYSVLFLLMNMGFILRTRQGFSYFNSAKQTFSKYFLTSVIRFRFNYKAWDFLFTTISLLLTAADSSVHLILTQWYWLWFVPFTWYWLRIVPLLILIHTFWNRAHSRYTRKGQRICWE
jgi:hypothetical protein